MRHDFRDGYVLIVDNGKATVYAPGMAVLDMRAASDHEDLLCIWAQNVVTQHIRKDGDGT